MNIASGKETAILDVIETISKVSGLKADLVFHPPRTGDVERFYLSNVHAQKSIQFTPQVDLAQGIQQTWTDYCGSVKERVEVKK